MKNERDCIYYEDDVCLKSPIEASHKCDGICEYYHQKKSWRQSIAIIFGISIFIYMLIFISYGIGKHNGKEEAVTRARCMQYMIEKDKCYSWVKK